MAEVDFSRIEDSVNNCCLECNGCSNKRCLVGFSKEIVKFFYNTHEKDYPNAIKYIPKTDFKVYDEDVLVDSIAEILIQCRGCGVDHRKDCIIGTIRASLERALFGDNLEDFKGNSLTHIFELSGVNPKLGHDVMVRYNMKKS